MSMMSTKGHKKKNKKKRKQKERDYNEDGNIRDCFVDANKQKKKKNKKYKKRKPLGIIITSQSPLQRTDQNHPINSPLDEVIV